MRHFIGRSQLIRPNSANEAIRFCERMRYSIELLAMKLGGLGQEPDFSGERRSIPEYRDVLARHAGKRLEDCRVLEIGFGQRPWRLCWLAALGVDIVGVDLERPVLRGTPAEFLRIYRDYGTERALRSLVRFLLFDRRERRAIAREIESQTGRPFSMPIERLRVVNAASEELWRSLPGLDFIYSEDVFEHIPAADLERIVPAMAAALKPDGLALVRPTVFTGITGGHDPEWYGYTLAAPRQRRSEPWEHLRRNRFPANTFLNRLNRAQYRRLLSRDFEIVEERVEHPDLGRSYLTAELRAELSAYDEDELFSNTVMFLLRPRRKRGHPEGVPRAGAV